jgi:hypothetical protein
MRSVSSFLFIACMLSLTGCSRCSPREKVNQGGELIGNTIGEFSEGVSSGVDKSFEINLTLSDALKSRGLTTGKVRTGETDNILVVYFIYSKDFSDTLTFKAFDNKNSEMGRVKVGVNGKQGDAGYVDVVFDQRTNLDNDSKVTVE